MQTMRICGYSVVMSIIPKEPIQFTSYSIL